MDKSPVSPPQGHVRNKSSIKAAARPRSSTKGPLDADDSLVVSPTSPPSVAGNAIPALTPPRHAATSLTDRTPARYLPRRISSSPSSGFSPGRPGSSGSAGSGTSLRRAPLPGSLGSGPGGPLAQTQQRGGGKPKKDFSYLLRPEIYHPLPPVNLPPAFRTAAHLQPDPDTPLPELLATGRFRAAAIAAAQQLTGTGGAPHLDPIDAPRVFDLLYTRLACLILIDATALAAQEGKALEDLNSPFYRAEEELVEGEAEEEKEAGATGKEAGVERGDGGGGGGDRATPAGSPGPIAPHLVPWPLRVLNVRLQALGFGDPRRAVMSYYELAREARAHVAAARARHDHAASELWKDRLADLGIQVTGALIEMDDLTGAAAHLASMTGNASRAYAASTPAVSAAGRRIEIAKALLWLYLGDTEAARAAVQAVAAAHPGGVGGGGDDDSDSASKGKGKGKGKGTAAAAGDMVPRVVAALCDMADDDYEGAVARWQALREDAPDDEMIRVNLAVCLLYVGKMEEGRGVLEGLVDAGYSSHTLLFNLSTIYELCTDRSKNLKLQLAERVAAMEPSAVAGWEKPNADFKL